MKKKLNYVVLLESSVIYGKPIRKEVIELVKNYSSNQNLNIKFYVPELVFEESKKHLLDDFLEAQSKHDSITNELSVLLNNSRLEKIVKSEKEIFNIVKKAFSDNKILILETPYIKIDWKDLIVRAVYRKLPFSREKEKGFKDAIIAETIIEHLSKLSKNSVVAILVQDELLTKHLKEKTRRFKKIKFFPSVPDFESALRLHLLENDDKLIEEISKEAEAAFYKPLDKTSLFYREEFPKRMMETFPTLFANPKIKDNLYYGVRVWNQVETNWVPVSEPEYRVSKPIFIKKENNVYHWESTVIYRQVFENEPTRNAPVYAGFDNRGEYILEFKIRWESQLDGRGKIDSSTSKIVQIDYVPRENNLAVVSVWNVPMASGATLAGQGTVPVVFNPSVESEILGFEPEDKETES